MTGLIDRTVVWLTWRQLFTRRRVLLSIGMALAPVLITLGFMASADTPDTSAARFFMGLDRDIVVGTLLPLAAVIFGTTAFGAEIDDGTLIYLLVKPVARWRMVLSKYLVALCSTLAVIIPAVFLPWLMVRAASLPVSVPLSFLAGACLGAVLYCAIFVTLGLTTQRSLIIGLLYIVLVEVVLSRSIDGSKSLSVREYSIAFAQHVNGGGLQLSGPPVTMATVWTMGTIIFVGAFAYAIRRFTGYELAERV